MQRSHNVYHYGPISDSHDRIYDRIIDFELGSDTIDLSDLLHGTSQITTFVSNCEFLIRIDVDGDGSTDASITLAGHTILGLQTMINHGYS